ncbi:MAG: EAL domain-containing protein, partial [Oscillospiraceae bacterium]
VVEQFSGVNIQVQLYSFHGKRAGETAREMVCSLGKEPPALLHLLCGGHYGDIYDFTEAFNALNPVTRLTGGVAADILPENICGYVFTEKEFLQDGIVAAGLWGESLSLFTEANNPSAPISTCYILNRCDGGKLLEIEGKPGDQWCLEQFGMKELSAGNGWKTMADNDELIHFPMILEGHGGASRYVGYDGAKKEASLYFSTLPDNTRFRIGYVNSAACVQECFALCADLAETPVESLFVYCDTPKGQEDGHGMEWKLKPLGKTRICGALLLGELCFLAGRNEFLNGACSFVGVAEEVVYQEPDFSAFEELYPKSDDRRQQIGYILQKQSAAMSRENEKLMEELEKQLERADEEQYVDKSTGIRNNSGFSHDDSLWHFDKLCMAQIENFGLLVVKLGEQGYNAVVRKIAGEIGEYIEKNGYREKFFFYILNHNTFFMVANAGVSETKFMEIIHDLYSSYRVIRIEGTREMMMIRAALVLHQENLLMAGLSTLQNYRHVQSQFLISDDSVVDTPALSDEMQMIGVLNDAIDNNGVIPYYQGVYDNKTQKFDKYEALMRIRGADGTIYPPGRFMEISKKYHMYAALSRQMLTQVFARFAGREEKIAMNLSALDINLPEMRKFIFKELEKYGGTKNVVFEILEDENFENMDTLIDFIKEARKYGVGIGIDDFGNGYSNFLEIAKVHPDYIKIDMGIIKDLPTEENNRMVVETIVFLGEKLQARLVAEGVETKEIQDWVERLGVHCSQGYYFAVPAPYEQLRLGNRRKRKNP